jgi:hypothetical protein
MGLVTAERFKNLKQRVKNECAKRKYNITIDGKLAGSVESYASSVYDYSSEPATDKRILKEHYEKIAEPLNAINSDTFPDTGGDRSISETELLAMEAALSIYESEKYDASESSCKTGCTGLCRTACVTGCSSCGGACSSGCGSCGSSCGTSCNKNCADGCSGSCGTTCMKGCADCSTSCGTMCNKNCSVGCYTTCGVQCNNNCAGTSSI